jgi:hypothetical protein
MAIKHQSPLCEEPGEKIQEYCQTEAEKKKINSRKESTKERDP